MKQRLKWVFFLVCALLVFSKIQALDTWETYNVRYAAACNTALSDDLDDLVRPFLMTDSHPLKSKLDKIFKKTRAISSRHTMIEVGFIDKEPEPVTNIIVTRHRKMKGYIFKIYTDDYIDFHHGEPEIYTFLRRARGAKMIAEEIAKLGWDKTFKVPRKWIYQLPEIQAPLKKGHVHRRYILVEEDMDLLSLDEIRLLWKDGTMTKKHLDKLFYITTRLGLRGCCKYDNVPICKDGRMAFVDTQSNLRWPIAYNRMKHVLEGSLLKYWEEITQITDVKSVPTIIDLSDQ